MSQILSSLSDDTLAKMLTDGQIGVIPTDTVYGLVCSARDEQAVSRLYQAKGRHGKPGTVIAASVDQLVALGIKARYLKAVEHYWPNAVSVVIPTYELSYLHQGVGSVAVRIPKHPEICALLMQTGPLMTSSANMPGKSPACNISEAQAYFMDTVDFYVDGGEMPNDLSSTVIRIVDDAVEVLRQGIVKIDEETGRVL